MAIQTALAIASGVTQIAAGIQGARATNSAAKRSWRSALIDQANNNTMLQRRDIEQNRAARQTGYDAWLQERAARASVRNSAAGGGVAGPLISALIAEQMRTGASNQSRIRDQMDNNRLATITEGRSLELQTENRLQNTRTASFNLLDFANIAVNTGLSIHSGNKSLGPRGEID